MKARATRPVEPGSDTIGLCGIRPKGARRPAYAWARLSLLPLVLFSSVLFVGCEEEREIAVPPPALVEVKTAETTTESIRRRYVGYLHPWEVHQVGFLTGGRVREVKPAVGDELRVGDPIATLATDDHSIYVDLASIQTEAVEPNVQRVRELVERNILPRSQLDELEARYQAALTQQRQANLKLSQTRLSSPVKGVVMMRLANPGQVIGPGMPVVIVLEVDRLEARFGIPQRDLAWFKEGATVQVRIPGVEGTRSGEVRRIDVTPDAKTRTYGLSVTLDNEERELRVGMICHLELVVEELTGIFVPLNSVSRDRDGAHQVKILDESGDHIASRRVTLGERIGDQVLVSDGLTEGERILVRGQTFVRDGDRVLVR